jgi:hypothetical protein
LRSATAWLRLRRSRPRRIGRGAFFLPTSSFSRRRPTSPIAHPVPPFTASIAKIVRVVSPPKRTKMAIKVSYDPQPEFLELLTGSVRCPIITYCYCSSLDQGTPVARPVRKARSLPPPSGEDRPATEG